MLWMKIFLKVQMKVSLKVLDWLFTDRHDLLLQCLELCNLTSLLTISRPLSWKSSLLYSFSQSSSSLGDDLIWWSTARKIGIWIGFPPPSLVGIKCKIRTVTKLVNQTYKNKYIYKCIYKYRLVNQTYDYQMGADQLQNINKRCFWIIWFCANQAWEQEKADLEISAPCCCKNPSFLLKTKFSSLKFARTCRKQVSTVAAFTQQVLLANSTVCFNYNFANKTDEDVITAATASYSHLQTPLLFSKQQNIQHN